ncbi:unnamed protein product [Zymoseptoria tritici ST99CH_1A5]|uniref:Uncharacterized protein n=4 Tax=Zymoseptoria tritici TaxID=1047171 RepID=F9XFN0_ZYMTI|nr:uncharacterized protein MYCGRDRAFT_110160 [Zymoseptoria tritici IPO323]SMQ52427.1 unnamed protein product [Zymoseptoria tritici ST99CH_3D7]SMR55254.1 unnamed protein product [Zymoseptoria tritici ST99CH_1E4]SMR57629.1 unnamed protein product [Zymoseptoria tritici ST99CH_3D1]SMY26067.1 unnamed protein product [Zymoseptoria tritici ST99CH_1A5]EGP86154.1 hypothetical protein MYCGRDRAFT_110160 [Zymoseptoria tritici IPO323]
MSSQTTFGATIVPTLQTSTPDRNYLLAPKSESPALTPTVSNDDTMQNYTGEKPILPHSPFYTHPPASNEVVNKHSLSVFEKDIESGNTTPLSRHDAANPFSKSLAVENSTECTMWPSKQTLRQQKQAQKSRKREKSAFAPVATRWANLSKKQKMASKILLALFLIGAAVALGVGISVAVKGAYYVSDGSSKAVGN